MLVDVTPVFDNTTMQAYYNNSNVLRGYYIYPAEGYVLHTKNFDTPVIDEENLEETGEVLAGYTRASIIVGYNYNFETNPFDIYAILESEVPADRIFGDIDDDHEVM